MTATTPIRLVVVSAGLTQPSATRLLADRLAGAAAGRLRSAGRAVEVHVVEVREHARGIADAFTTGFPPASLRAELERVERADALIAVTPIFSASYSGLFKSFFDVLDKDALAGTPVLIAASGGTARHSLALEHALRPLFGYLRAVVAPTAVYAAPEDWAGAHDGAAGTGPALAERIDRAAGELAALLLAGAPAAATPSATAEVTGTGSEARARIGAPADPFEDVVPFEQQLAALRTTGGDMSVR